MLLDTPLPNRLHRGKVRDLYQLNDDLLLMVATDRISAFDVVLPNGIPDKGKLLSRMSAFWFRQTRHIVPNHFLCMADDPDAAQLCGNAPLLRELPPEVAQQAMIVQRARRIDIECIVRGYITGSAWREYRSEGKVWGQPMPPGMMEGQAFPEPFFTPTTKAEEGHDQNMTQAEVVALAGESVARQLEQMSKALYQFAHDYARPRGVILSDTKFEFGWRGGQLILIDEALTPDSSRFWDAQTYAPGVSLSNYDKQFVRDWLLAQNWNQTPPAPELPPDIVEKTAERYHEAYHRLTGQRL